MPIGFTSDGYIIAAIDVVHYATPCYASCTTRAPHSYWKLLSFVKNNSIVNENVTYYL